MTSPSPLPRTDGVVTLRATRESDAARLIAARDDQFHRFLGPGSPEPQPTAVIEVDGEVAGWVDHDPTEAHPWLEQGQTNVGYHVHAPHRGRGHASRAVRLLLDLLREQATFSQAMLLVDAENEPSLRVARSVGAVEVGRRMDDEGRPQVLFAIDLAHR